MFLDIIRGHNAESRKTINVNNPCVKISIDAFVLMEEVIKGIGKVFLICQFLQAGSVFPEHLVENSKQDMVE